MMVPIYNAEFIVFLSMLVFGKEASGCFNYIKLTCSNFASSVQHKKASVECVVDTMPIQVRKHSVERKRKFSVKGDHFSY